MIWLRRILILPLALLLVNVFELPRGIEWQEAVGHRLSKLKIPEEGKVGFTQLATIAIGIQFTNRVSRATLARRSNLASGSGVALGDTNGDGLCDIYFCRLEGDNELYLNQGDWRFQRTLNANGAAAADGSSRITESPTSDPGDRHGVMPSAWLEPALTSPSAEVPRDNTLSRYPTRPSLWAAVLTPSRSWDGVPLLFLPTHKIVSVATGPFDPLRLCWWRLM